MSKSTKIGSQIYTPFTLKLYDWWVLKISNHFAWKCPTHDVLVPHFTEYAGNEHLDIGVGTGFYLTHLPETTHISLMDINTNSLAVARNRIGSTRIKECIQHDVFEPFPAQYHGYFDSISMFYLLHCLPGTLKDKVQVIANTAKGLKTGGTLYGATILGNDAGHNRLGKKLMKVYNSKGIFSNKDDTEDGLHAMLSFQFHDVAVNRVGMVVLFTATGRRE